MTSTNAAAPRGASVTAIVVGLCFAIAAIRLRGDFGKIAAGGLIAAGSQVGIVLGIIIINIWHN